MNLKINTERGVYRYKFVPIFQGIKRIDKKIAHENLLILKRLCDEAGLKFILFYGSLLGAVREHDFITHDEDIDVVMYKSDMPKFLNLLFDLRKEGFELARYERRGFLSIIRKSEYIDVYFYEPYPQDPELWYCCQDICKKEYVLDLMPYEFLGDEYLVPRNYIGYMEYYFGSNWRTPIQQFDYNKSSLAKFKEYAIQYIKASLPPAVAEWRQRKTDAPKLQHWLDKIYKDRK
ncbi:LicD family protein [uncultured Prevotella sp.]|uniref:LicD family protein n=1 Tax=uncultured Prevotella sp. TaxID=159272 RepID=UPI0026707FC6|nr:LicD family protein [uncultured Prevotella sp.]